MKAYLKLLFHVAKCSIVKKSRLTQKLGEGYFRTFQQQISVLVQE